MPHYKTKSNKLYWLDSVEEESFLPNGCIKIDDEEAEIIRQENIQKALDSRTYAEKRLSEYPPLIDYIDGVVKGDQKQIDAYIAACKAVKNKYPKE